MIMKTMLRILTSVLTLTVATPVFAATIPVTDSEKTDDAPAITFKEKQYDFGYIAENGGPVTHIFEFVNTGTAPLVIVSATASCGCTRPSYPMEPIAPGKKGKIKVTYLPQGRPGEFDKTVKVRTNAKSSKKFALKIKGTVVPDK